MPVFGNFEARINIFLNFTDFVSESIRWVQIKLFSCLLNIILSPIIANSLGHFSYCTIEIITGLFLCSVMFCILFNDKLEMLLLHKISLIVVPLAIAYHKQDYIQEHI